MLIAGFPDYLINFIVSYVMKVGGVSVLLEICRTPPLRFALGEALRALATICCVSESIEQLDEVSYGEEF